jgi:hypothetical protein
MLLSLEYPELVRSMSGRIASPLEKEENNVEGLLARLTAHSQCFCPRLFANVSGASIAWICAPGMFEYSLYFVRASFIPTGSAGCTNRGTGRHAKWRCLESYVAFIRKQILTDYLIYGIVPEL